MRAHISFFSGTGQGEGGANASAASICSVKISQIAQKYGTVWSERVADGHCLQDERPTPVGVTRYRGEHCGGDCACARLLSRRAHALGAFPALWGSGDGNGCDDYSDRLWAGYW